MTLLRTVVVASIFAALLAAAPGARAAGTVALQGTVLLPDGTPAAGARVFVGFYGPEGWTMSEVHTDAAGKFSCPVPAARKDQPVHVLALRADCAATWGQSTPGDALVLRLGATSLAFAGAVSGPDGKPLAGAEVAITQLAGTTTRGSDWITLGGAAWRVTVGPDGRFSWPDLPSGATIYYSVRAAGMAAVNDQWTLGGGNLSVALLRGSTVSGRVLQAGKPVPHTVVTATMGQGSHVEQATTGADGSYTVAQLGLGPVVLRVAGAPTGLCSTIRVPFISTTGQTLTGQDLLLTPGAVLSGRVTAAVPSAPVAAAAKTGAPLQVSLTVYWAPAGVRLGTDVTAGGGGYAALPAPPGAATLWAKSLLDGTWQLRVPPGQVLVTVSGSPAGSTSKWPSEPFQRRLEVTEGGTYADLGFALTAPPQIAGRVLRSDGKPAAGVQVLVPSQGYYNPTFPTVETDAAGKFSADFPSQRGRGGRSFPIMARDPATGQIGLTFVAGPQDPAEIRLDTGGYLLISAVDGEGRPQAGVGITTYLTAANQRPAAMLPGGTTDGQGHLRLGPLPLGVEIRVTPNYQQQAFLLDTTWRNLAEITLHSGKEREMPPLRIDLRGREISGTVLDPDGHPVAQALVACSLLRQQATTTDEHGAFTLTGVPLKGDMELLAVDATRPLFGVLPLGADDRDGLGLRLQALGAITGTVVDANGKPVAAAEVTVSSALLNSLGNTTFWARLTAAGYAPGPASSDTRGRWETRALLPGTYTLSLRAGQGLTANGEAAVDPGQTKDLGKLTVKPLSGPGSIPPPVLPGASGPAPKD